MKRVLVVSDDPRVADPIAEGLEAAGVDVSVCPGPRSPSYVCYGVRCGRCALAEGSDVVVLDGWLASDAARMGVPAWHLLLFYRQLGLDVVALIGADALPGPVYDPRIRVLQRDADPPMVAEAIASLGADARRL